MQNAEPSEGDKAQMCIDFGKLKLNVTFHELKFLTSLLKLIDDKRSIAQIISQLVYRRVVRNEDEAWSEWLMAYKRLRLFDALVLRHCSCPPVLHDV